MDLCLRCIDQLFIFIDTLLSKILAGMRDRWMLFPPALIALNFYENSTLSCLIRELDVDLPTIKILIRVLMRKALLAMLVNEAFWTIFLTHISHRAWLIVGVLTLKCHLVLRVSEAELSPLDSHTLFIIIWIVFWS